MKWAKVSKGLVHHVWPRFKNGEWHEMPDCYRGLNGKPIPECIVQVPDDVKPGWKWNGERYAPRPKKPLPERVSFKELIRRQVAKALAEANDSGAGKVDLRLGEPPAPKLRRKRRSVDD